jgi:hypothetical protein
MYNLTNILGVYLIMYFLAEKLHNWHFLSPKGPEIGHFRRRFSVFRQAGGAYLAT